MRGPTQEIPFSLRISSLRMAVYEQMTSEQNAQIRLRELESLDEVRLTAKQNIEFYQARTSRAFNRLYDINHLRKEI